MKVYPVEGRLVPHPRTHKPVQIPPEGFETHPADEMYWARRVNHGDVSLTLPEQVHSSQTVPEIS